MQKVILELLVQKATRELLVTLVPGRLARLAFRATKVTLENKATLAQERRATQARSARLARLGPQACRAILEPEIKAIRGPLAAKVIQARKVIRELATKETRELPAARVILASRVTPVLVRARLERQAYRETRELPVIPALVARLGVRAIPASRVTQALLER